MGKMKVLSIGNFGRGWDGSICDEEHVASALEELGHEVTRFQREEIRNAFPVGHYDFVLVSQWGNYPEDLLTYRMQYVDAPIVYWAFDYQADGQDWHERIIKGADLYLSKRIADSKYKNWQWLSQDFAPSYLDRKEGIEKDIDVLFTGSYVGYGTERIDTLKFVDQHFNLQVYSVTPNEWKEVGLKNVHGPVLDEDLPGLIARAKVNLSVDLVLENGYWSDRNAQIMACGGFVLFRYIPMAEAIFKDNIAYFDSPGDCVEKLGHYLEHPIIRDNIAKAGYQHAKKNMMVKNRVKDLLTIVENTQ